MQNHLTGRHLRCSVARPVRLLLSHLLCCACAVHDCGLACLLSQTTNDSAQHSTTHHWLCHATLCFAIADAIQAMPSELYWKPVLTNPKACTTSRLFRQTRLKFLGNQICLATNCSTRSSHYQQRQAEHASRQSQFLPCQCLNIGALLSVLLETVTGAVTCHT